MRNKLLFLTGLALLSVYCHGKRALESASFRVGVLQELSSAAPRKGIPLFSEKDFYALVGKVATVGGEIGFGSITARDVPLARLRVPKSGNAYERKSLEHRVGAFRLQVIDKLSVQLVDRIDPVFALNRVDTFFHEAGRNTQQYLIYVGGVSRPGVSMPSLLTKGVHVLVVASPGYQPRIRDAIYFESVAAAIDYIGNDNSQGGNK